jgi:putative flippase GtrA
MNKHLSFILTDQKTQIVRFALTGLLLNLLWYSVYLGLSRIMGLKPMVSIAVCYPFALAFGYWSHFKVTFRKTRDSLNLSTSIRYISSTVLIFCVNLTILYVFNVLLSYRHEYVQFVAIVACAGLSFLVLKEYVYK